MNKIIIYQVLPRLFGNDNCGCIYNGDLEQNGCGKLSDFNKKTLNQIKKLGVTHIWYTGLLEHATQTHYPNIPHDHGAIVKGKAGSPYAIKDYYDIDPDLAKKPQKRFDEFLSLIERTHSAGLKFIMDFVPNHLARQYHSDNAPKGTKDFGEDDKPQQSFTPNNNFYYIPNSKLSCQFDMQSPEYEPYIEIPAKATGNDCFHATPSKNDWYETIKLNYGIDYCSGGTKYFNPIPDTWLKMRDILLFWASKGIDGFRCDMAEMVPCEFWQWVIKEIKKQYPNIIFIAEVYNPAMYRDYIYRGGFDYLYDKVGLYDTLRNITTGNAPASNITFSWQATDDIRQHMLNFLENHDEQRIASSFFAGDANKGRAPLIVSATMNTNPFMLYFGQEFGELGMDNEGYSGCDGRTTIFDYWSISSIRKWRASNYSLKNMSDKEKDLYNFYKKILTLSISNKALSEGKFFDLMYVNYENPYFNPTKTYAYIRSNDDEFIIIAVNFSDNDVEQRINIPQHAFDFLQLPQGNIKFKDLLTVKSVQNIKFNADNPFPVTIPANSGIMLSACK